MVLRYRTKRLIADAYYCKASETREYAHSNSHHTLYSYASGIVRPCRTTRLIKDAYYYIASAFPIHPSPTESEIFRPPRVKKKKSEKLPLRHCTTHQFQAVGGKETKLFQTSLFKLTKAVSYMASSRPGDKSENLVSGREGAIVPPYTTTVCSRN